MPGIIGKCKTFKIKRLLVVTCLTVMVLLFTSCSVFGTDEIATVEGGIYLSPQIDPISWTTHGYVVEVRLKPTEIAQPNTIYSVDLYENGNLRASTTVSWNQLELNIQKTKDVTFPASKAEYDVYDWNDMSNIFSVKVYE